MKTAHFLIGIIFFGTIANAQESPLVNIETYGGTYAYDVKYATDDNFLKQAVYDLSLIHISEPTRPY